MQHTYSRSSCFAQHWFQDRIHQDIQDGKRHCRERQLCPACLDIEHTLVVAMWRNPYDWISGMQKIPWHAQVRCCCCLFTFFFTYIAWVPALPPPRRMLFLRVSLLISPARSLVLPLFPCFLSPVVFLFWWLM